MNDNNKTNQVTGVFAMPTQSGRSPIGLLLARITQHVAATLIALMMAILGAESTKVGISLIVVGAAFDALRHRYAPEIRNNQQITLKKFDEISGDIALLQSNYHWWMRRILLTIYITSFSYTALWSVIDTGSVEGQKVLSAFSEVHAFISSFVSIIRRHTEELSAQGYAARSALTAHIYAVHYLTFVAAATAFLLGAAWHHARLIAFRQAMGPKSIQLEIRRRSGFYPFMYFVLVIAGYAFMEHLQWIDWQSKARMAWDIQKSNAPFFLSYFLMSVLSMGIGEGYTRILLYAYDRKTGEFAS